MAIAEQVTYWQALAASDLEVARRFLRRGDDLHYCLFFGLMSLEKLIKALVVIATHSTPPRIHDLIKLAERASLSLDADLKEKLDLFNDFNVRSSLSGLQACFL